MNRPKQNKANALKGLLDVPLELSVVLGRTRLSIEELLQLTTGSVVRLDRLQGEPLEIYVGGKLLAHGEAVVVNDHLGIRITDVVAAPEPGTLEESA